MSFLKHTDYTNLFKSIAEQHIELLHSESEEHFARIVLNRDPILGGHAQVAEFLSKKRSSLKTPFMLLVAYVAGYNDNPSADAKRKVFNGAFVILDKAENGNFDAEEIAFDKTERIGDEILGYLMDFFENNPQLGFLEWNGMGNEKIAKLTADNFTGTRFEVSFSVPAQSYLEFKPSQFGQ